MGVPSESIPALRPVIQQVVTRMEKTATDFRAAVASVRTGRASVHLLDGVRVEYYGTEMPLNQLGQVHSPDPQSLTVQPFDAGALGAIEKAIRTADLGLNPANDGKMIRIPVPPLTTDRRQELVKHVHKILEDHRTGIRNIRRDGNESIKKLKAEKKIGEDEERRGLDDVQKLTEAEMKKLEEISEAKEKEITKL